MSVRILILFISFLAFGCGNESEQGNSVKETTAITDSLFYKYIVREDSVWNDSFPLESKSYVYYKYPVFLLSDSILADSLNAYALWRLTSKRNVPALIDTLLSDFVVSYKGMTYGEISYAQSWNSNNEVNVVRQNRKIISLEYSVDEYMGGAHPGSYSVSTNWLIDERRVVKLTDLFDSLALIKFTKLAELQFRKERELLANADLDEEGFWFKDNQFTLNDNFLITKNSIAFFFNSYEIGPYAIGPTYIEIPLSSFEKLLKSEANNFFE